MLVSMTKSFRPYDLHQQLLFPPSLQDWVPEDHLARFVSDVVDTLDLSSIYASYDAKDPRGARPYHPAMLVKLLVYAYCTGLCSSRRIERATYDDVAFRFLSADQHPDHDVQAGELFLAAIYNAIHDNPALWESTALLITYDEHGGIYDHVPPPPCTPDGMVAPAVQHAHGLRALPGKHKCELLHISWY